MNLQISLNPQEVHGNWRAGYALDLHTPSRRDLSSKTHTAIGEMVHQVKHQHPPDRSKIRPIAEIATRFVKEEFTVDRLSLVQYHPAAVIPTPPSKKRSVQPVTKIAKEIGHLLNLPVHTKYLIKEKQTRPLRNLPYEERRAEIQGAFVVHSQDLKGRCVLLFDDICDSGATLQEATKVLYEQGCVRYVFVLALTQARKGRNRGYTRARR